MKTIGSGTVEGISTRVDGSVILKIATQELDSADAARLFDMRNKFIKYLLTDSNITPLDEQLIEEVKIRDGKKVKSHSQRLRAVLFRIHEQSNFGVDFENFYATEMERIIDHYKSKLNQEAA